MNIVMNSINSAVCVTLMLFSSSVCADDPATAAEEHRWEDLATFSQKELITARQPDGMTALHWAVFHQNPKAVRRLLEAGANANAATEYDVTPLYTASGRSNSAIVELLLKHKADPNKSLPGGESPLMAAARIDQGILFQLFCGPGRTSTMRKSEVKLLSCGQLQRATSTLRNV